MKPGMSDFISLTRVSDQIVWNNTENYKISIICISFKNQTTLKTAVYSRVHFPPPALVTPFSSLSILDWISLICNWIWSTIFSFSSNLFVPNTISWHFLWLSNSFSKERMKEQIWKLVSLKKCKTYHSTKLSRIWKTMSVVTKT